VCSVDVQQSSFMGPKRGGGAMRELVSDSYDVRVDYKTWNMEWNLEWHHMKWILNDALACNQQSKLVRGLTTRFQQYGRCQVAT